MTMVGKMILSEKDKPVVAKLRDVSKRFTLRQDKSVKDRVLQFQSSRAHEQDFWALQGISLDLKAGTTTGFIGPNGSGKSTLLKVIGGIIEADVGEVLTRGRIAALLELGAGFHPDLTGRENVFLNASILGMTRQEAEAKFDDIVAFSGIHQFIDTPVKFYSSGMYVRLAFSVAIHSDPDILLVDEVLAVGDEAFQQKCLAKIQDFQAEGRAIVIVSHSMGQITALCDRAIVLNRGNVLYDGDPQEAVTVMRRGFMTNTDSSTEVDTNISAVEHTESGYAPVSPEILAVVPRLPDTGFHSGEDLTVHVRFRVPEELPNWDLTLSLVNSLGMTVLVTSARSSGSANSRIQGEASVEFTLPNLYVGQGGYSLEAAFFDDKQREICRTAGEYGFEVVAGPESIGPVYSPVSSRVSSQEGAP